MKTHYHGSRGSLLIADMLYPHLLNARDKLVRDQTDGERQDEIDAMTARLAEIDAMADDDATFADAAGSGAIL